MGFVYSLVTIEQRLPKSVRGTAVLQDVDILPALRVVRKQQKLSLKITIVLWLKVRKVQRDFF